MESARHSLLNSIIADGLTRSGMPCQLEPLHLARDDGRRPDGITLVPFAQGRHAVWDVTVVSSLGGGSEKGQVCCAFNGLTVHANRH